MKLTIARHTGSIALLLNLGGLSMVFLLALSCSANAQTINIFVDTNSLAVYEDGTARAPFRTVTRGLEHARRIRFDSLADGVIASDAMIHIQVAAGTYVGSFEPADFDPLSPSYDPSKEKLPLLLNTPGLTLRGETVIVADEDGLPSSIVDGTATIIRPSRAQAQKEYLVMVTRTRARAGSGFPEATEMAGDDVTIAGFWLEGAPGPTGPVVPSALIGIDRVTGFVVDGNVLTSGANGVWTRLSSGRLQGNLATNNTVGLLLTGGSDLFPARLEIRGNRITNTGVSSFSLLGAGETGPRRHCLSFGANADQFERVPLPSDLNRCQNPPLPLLNFDRTLTPDEVPDAIDARVVGNAFDGGGALGIRLAGYLGDGYSLVPGQDETAHITAEFRNNVSRGNAMYGLVADAGQISLGDRRIVTMDLSFDGTKLEQNGRGPDLFSFWRFAGSIGGGPFSAPNPTFAHDSRITVCGDVTKFHYDNRQDPDPPTNPAPTNNRLTVNTVELMGLQIDDLFEVPRSSPECGR